MNHKFAQFQSKKLSFLQKVGCVLLGFTPMEVQTQVNIFETVLGSDEKTLELIHKVNCGHKLHSTDLNHLKELEYRLEQIQKTKRAMFDAMHSQFRDQNN